MCISLFAIRDTATALLPVNKKFGGIANTGYRYLDFAWSMEHGAWSMQHAGCRMKDEA